MVGLSDWCFYDGAGSAKPSEDVQLHISAINQRELENKRVKRLGEWTTNQDDDGIQM